MEWEIIGLGDMVEDTPVPEPAPAKSSLDTPLPADEKAVQDEVKVVEESEEEGVKSEATGFDSEGRPTGVAKTD